MKENTVGILAYGSLIGNPGAEIDKVAVRRITDVMTPFPVEYARSSGGRGNAPTLVPYDKGSPVRAHIIVVNTSVEDATDRLYRREIDAIGTGKRYRPKRNPGPKDVVIRQHPRLANVDIVLYTEIGANISELTAAELAQLAIESVAKADQGRDGITYLKDAISYGIKTPLTDAYEAEIKRRTGAGDLASALAQLKAGE